VILFIITLIKQHFSNSKNIPNWIPDKSAELDSNLSDIFAADFPE
jgi:hypothetical protein